VAEDGDEDAIGLAVVLVRRLLQHSLLGKWKEKVFKKVAKAGAQTRDLKIFVYFLMILGTYRCSPKIKKGYLDPGGVVLKHSRCLRLRRSFFWIHAMPPRCKILGLQTYTAELLANSIVSLCFWGKKWRLKNILFLDTDFLF
jgi:hypothetical protein